MWYCKVNSTRLKSAQGRGGAPGYKSGCDCLFLFFRIGGGRDANRSGRTNSGLQWYRDIRR